VREFEYVVPGSVAEAVDVLRRFGGDAKVIAGGQSLVPLLNYRLAAPRAIVDINGLPLDGVRVDGGRLRLGALTRHATLEESDVIRTACPLLREAAGLIGNVRVRTLGTLGGSLAHADPAAELPMVMLALDARFTAVGPAGARVIPVAEFFTGYLTTALRSDEVLTEIDVPATPISGHAIEEHSRRAGDFALVAVAALVWLARDGRIADVRLAFGGVGPAPVRARAAEDGLRGQPPSAEALERAATMAAGAIEPAGDAFASAAYRKLLARVLARRALTRAAAGGTAP
jgi:carbon-monoxide dehydrogenase medium subunit